MNDDDLIDLLYLIPSITRLELFAVEIGQSFFSHFEATTFTPLHSDNNSHQFLPNLQTFIFDAERTFSWSAVATMAPTRSLESNMIRRPLAKVSISTYPLNLEPGPEPIIDREYLEKILASTRDGVTFAIWEARETNLNVIQQSLEFHQMDQDGRSIEE
ncbi:hypothetical protein CPB83DRAFT_846605 [Crepidotus variabilis]|uniref:Uncharacterized protein n=1 Tax=Crepidotus variabilis TaxID=179855 RepID=A0A9P6EQN7_9AGAR|nr:hypothetical protein CPB83DRAFT_846605 [Crepidotus variabilis]